MLDDELSEVREKLIAISTNSEASSEEERLDLAQVWGVPVFDEYSTEEVPGVLASQSHCRSYHVHEEYCIAERVKVNSASEPNSDMGKLIVTSLIHSNTPIIRYEQGDFVQFESESVCSCGQKGLRIKAFLGRENDSFLLYDGGIVPSGRLLDIGYTILLEHSSIKSWKMRQTRLDCIVFEYASDIEMLAHEITDIKNIISSNIDNSIKVNLKRVIEIEKAQSGKLNQVVREF
jgi:phenylacetate-coenzyme A ligase PaaK-like adenylate-forming protein